MKIKKKRLIELREFIHLGNDTAQNFHWESIRAGSQTGDNCNSFSFTYVQARDQQNPGSHPECCRFKSGHGTSCTATQGFPRACVSNFKHGTCSCAKASHAWLPWHSLLCTCCAVGNAALKADGVLFSQRPGTLNSKCHACLWPFSDPVGAFLSSFWFFFF